MLLDVRTLLFAMAAVTLCNAVILTLAWRYAKSLRIIIGYWSCSQLLISASVALMALRNAIPDFFSIVVATVCIVGSQVAIQEGIAHYLDKPGCLRKPALLVWGIATACSVFLTYIAPSVNLRIVAYSLATVLLCLLGVRLMRSRDTGGDAPRRFLIVLFVLYAGLMSLRAAVALVQDQYAGLLSTSAAQEWIALGILCFCTSLSLCLFWMVAHQLGLDVQKQALTDSLTGVANRRALDNMIMKLQANATPVGIGFLLIDIDGFKAINDRFGHQAGDAYLVRFAQVLAQNLRADDAVFRYAGDEFVVLAQNCEAPSVMNAAERLRNQIAELTVTWHGQQLRSTVSIGVVLPRGAACVSDDLLHLAEEALYRAKRAGGNGIAVAD